MGVIIVLEITCGVGGTSAGCDMPPRPSDKRSLYGRMAGDNISTMVDGHYIFDFPSIFDVYDDGFQLDGFL
jgi:hypothetical protein